MTPLARYKQNLQETGFQHDPRQEWVMQQFERLYEDLLTTPETTSPSSSFLSRFFSKPAVVEKTPPKGLYIWGGVGRGKTHLTDMFFECLPFEDKLRLHFHRFMREVHSELRTIKDSQDTLEIVADRFAQRARIICLDEMHVHDITDAMLMGGLLDALFRRGVALVTTSNIEPDGLYKDGLQRARFLPAIALLNEHTDVINMDSGIDYRMRTLEQAEIYHYPLDETADSSLEETFHNLTTIELHNAETHVEINGREIEVKMWADGIAWFTFDSLCNTPRSTHDYIEMAELFHTILISDVPQLDDKRNDEARRWINLVDEFYDRNVTLIISAEVDMVDLYDGKRLAFEFQRTISRLQEMQSLEYLGREHLKDCKMS